MSFWQAKTKINSLDKLFSEYVRRRDGECQYRVKCYGKQEWKTLHNSHYFGRAKKSVRYNPENCDAACPACHMFVHENPKWLDEWKEKQLGTQRFALLTLRANTPSKIDETMMKIVVKQMLKNLDSLEGDR